MLPGSPAPVQCADEPGEWRCAVQKLLRGVGGSESLLYGARFGTCNDYRREPVQKGMVESWQNGGVGVAERGGKFVRAKTHILSAKMRDPAPHLRLPESA